MNAGAGAATGPLAVRAVRGEEITGSPNAPGRLLGRLTVLPALVVMAWLLAGLPLLLAGVFTPLLMVAVAVPLAALLVVFGLRWVPDRWQSGLAAPGPGHERTPWWALAGVVAVAVAFGVHQMIYHSQQIIVLRDPASYIQFGYWIAHHGSLPIPQSRAAFGGTHHVLSFGSAAFYQVGNTIVPQFMAGLPMILAAGFWIGGVGSAVALAPVLGALAVLTFGGLAARLVGPRWAPLAALVLALSLPEQFTSRSTYSEPVVQILFLGGLCLVIDSLEAGKAGARVTAALGGLALGLTVLVRIDGASDILPVIAYCGLLLVGRRRQAMPLTAGLVAGTLLGGIDGFVLSRPYLAAIKSSLDPLLLAVGAVVVVTAVAVLVLRNRGLPEVRGNWLPNAAAAAAFAVLAAFTIRPYVQTVRSSQPIRYLARYQREQHLPIDPYRQYSEISLHWVIWYIGVPAVLLGTLGAALLARRCLRGRMPTWTLPLMIFAWTIVTTLYRPAIIPDHPWASRRLVPAVLPGFILLALWASSWLAGWLRERQYDRVLRGGLLAGCAAVLVLPTAMTAFGLGIRTGGPQGIRPVVHGLGFRTTWAGEIRAVDRLCAAIPRDSSVVMTDHSTSRLAEVVRGMCGVPVAIMSPHPGTVEQVVQGIEQAGRRPVFLAGKASELAPYGGPATKVMALRTQGDGHSLTVPPMLTRTLRIDVWMWEPGS